MSYPRPMQTCGGHVAQRRLRLVKSCRCCLALYTLEEYLMLDDVGQMGDLEDEDEGVLLELRNCTCGSTLALAVAFGVGPGGRAEARCEAYGEMAVP